VVFFYGKERLVMIIKKHKVRLDNGEFTQDNPIFLYEGDTNVYVQIGFLDNDYKKLLKDVPDGTSCTVKITQQGYDPVSVNTQVIDSNVCVKFTVKTDTTNRGHGGIQVIVNCGDTKETYHH
jgi:hypothetical protein